MAEHRHIRFCERCGAELLPADPAPLCASCFVSDKSVVAPSLLMLTNESWSGTTPSRTGKAVAVENTFTAWTKDDGSAAKHRRMISRRVTLALAAVLTAAMLFALVPAAISSTEPGPVHLGVQQVDKSTDACLANLYILVADKLAGRASPSDIVCPSTGKPYVYTQYQGVTTISCPDPVSHEHTKIYIRTDTRVPVVN